MRKRIVKHQDVGEVKSGRYDSSERSPYWDHVDETGGKEPTRANPDLLPDTIEPPSGELEAILEVLNEGGLQVLSAQEREAFQFCVVEGLSERIAAAKMGGSRDAVRSYIKRGSKKLRKLCSPKL